MFGGMQIRPDPSFDPQELEEFLGFSRSKGGIGAD